jgi:integrase
MAESLNAAADHEKAAEGLPEGTVAWAIDKYRRSPQFTERALATRTAYEPYMRSLSETMGGYLLSELSRGMVREIVDGVEGAARKHHCVAVLSRLVSIARDYGYLHYKLTDNLGLPATGRREVIWTVEEEARLFAACDADARTEAARLGFMLLFYTGQRVSDMRDMAWSHFDGDKISVVQRKTGERRRIKCHRALRAALEAAYPQRRGLPIVAQPSGLAYTKPGWESVWKRLRAAVGERGMEIQMRDIRRTAAVRLAEAGCELHEIASVTGHSLKYLQVLFEVYLPKTTAMAESAIAKLEARTETE